MCHGFNVGSCITKDLMPSTGIPAAELILLLLLLFVVAFAALAQTNSTVKWQRACQYADTVANG
jgi:hypothetical protein